MVWQLSDPAFRRVVHDVIDSLGGNGALAGTVGVQVHVAGTIGLDKAGPPAHAIEVVTFDGRIPPDTSHAVPVVRVDALGFEASLKASCVTVSVGPERFPVAAPEHILGMTLAAPEVATDAKWACFILMRIFEGQLDLEEARGFLKRCGDPDRQSLLAELAYLAA